MWVPRWAGRVYSKLYVEFGPNLFKLSETVEVLKISENQAKVAFSLLHKRGFLTVFERKGDLGLQANIT
ncbi:MAG: hypothetical protein DRJ51_07450 [Thermoprotei archaeon]|nr:MAG: hypothetical protein DRJ51_07450 [Thermoprotei archaeon]